MVVVLTLQCGSVSNLYSIIKFEMRFHTHYAHDNALLTTSIQESILEEISHCYPSIPDGHVVYMTLER